MLAAGRRILAGVAVLATTLSAWAQAPVEVVYATPSDVTTMEPTQVSGFMDHTATLAVFGSLVFNFDGATGAVGYYPYLAERVEPLDDNTWLIQLRPGMTFHNGAPLNAEAIKFSFERVRHPDFPSGRYMHNAPIDSVEVIDELTVHVRTSRPISIFPARLLRADGYVVEPEHYADTPPWSRTPETAWNPVGAGPFKFVEHAPDDRMVLEVFDGFIDPRGYERPNFDRLILRVVPETSTLIAELLQGTIDIAPIPAEMVEVIERAPGVRVVAGPSTTRLAFMFNQNAHEALKDKRVRQAINYAIDVDELLEALTDGYGLRIPTHVNPPNEHPGLQPYPYDPERARALLAEAGWADGFEINIDWSIPSEVGRVAQAMVPYLEAVGIRVGEVRELDWGSVYIPRQTEKTLSGLHGHGHGGVEMTAETDMWTYHPNRSTNSTNWVGPEADRFVELYAQMQGATDPARLEALNYEIQELWYEEALGVTFWQIPRFVALSDRIEHYLPYPGGHNEDFWTIRVRE